MIINGWNGATNIVVGIVGIGKGIPHHSAEIMDMIYVVLQWDIFCIH